jgi:hypothetical protein
LKKILPNVAIQLAEYVKFYFPTILSFCHLWILFNWKRTEATKTQPIQAIVGDF